MAARSPTAGRDRSDLRASRPGSRRLDEGRRARSRPRLQRTRRRGICTRLRRAGGRHPRRLARSACSSARAMSSARPHRAGPDPGDVGRCPAGRRSASGHVERAEHHPGGAKPARDAWCGDGGGDPRFGASVAVPGADHRPAASADRDRRPSSAARPGPRGSGPTPSSRRDEIGLLARSVSDMSQSLRERIDNIEAFAADVTHELKNPIASLRSALDGIEKRDRSQASRAADGGRPRGRASARPADQATSAKLLAPMPSLPAPDSSRSTSGRSSSRSSRAGRAAERGDARIAFGGRARKARSSWAMPAGSPGRSTICSTMR
jgi:HAMP domain-containing protein